MADLSASGGQDGGDRLNAWRCGRLASRELAGGDDAEEEERGVGPEDSGEVIWHELFGEAPDAVEGQHVASGP